MLDMVTKGLLVRSTSYIEAWLLLHPNDSDARDFLLQLKAATREPSVFAGFDEKAQQYFGLEQHNSAATEADLSNFDTTDFPRKGCRLCGKRDRPQFHGVCNDDNCSH
jgi:hypothetical protein